MSIPTPCERVVEPIEDRLFVFVAEGANDVAVSVSLPFKQLERPLLSGSGSHRGVGAFAWRIWAGALIRLHDAVVDREVVARASVDGGDP